MCGGTESGALAGAESGAGADTEPETAAVCRKPIADTATVAAADPASRGRRRRCG